MTIQKALITAAGRNQQALPLQTLVDRDGFPRSVLAHLLEEAISAGIDSVGLVVSPGTQDLHLRAAGDRARRLTLIEQSESRGYADAICCGRDFLGTEPFLLMVSDHIYISRDPARSCARQLVDFASAENCTVSAVQATHESEISAFGTVGGRLYDDRDGVYVADRVMEKPTPTVAEQELMVPGLRIAHYLCFFGMHVLTSHVLDRLAAALAEAADPRTVHLATALDELGKSERHLAVELQGRRFDLDEQHGLLMAQLALALSGRERATVLAQVVKLLAELPPV